MASFETSVGLDDLMQSLTSIDIEAIAPVALEESAPIVKTKLVQLARATSGHRCNDSFYQSEKSEEEQRRLQHFRWT